MTLKIYHRPFLAVSTSEIYRLTPLLFPDKIVSWIALLEIYDFS